MSAFRVFACGLLAVASLSAQKREDFLQIQRDVAQMQDDVKKLQKSQDDRMASLEAMLKQALEGQTRLATSLSSMQASMTDTLAQQQQKVVAPMAALTKEVEQLSGDFRAVQSNVGELSGQIRRVDDKLADISSAVRTLSTPPAAPPPPTANATNEPTPPPGVTAENLFDNARRDFSAKHDDLAMKGFADYLMYFRETENAPRAQYYIGLIYERAEQYDDAVKAFGAVLERFPPGPFSSEAQYMRGFDLMKAKRNTEAAAEFQALLKEYPQSDRAADARMHLRQLGAAPAAPKPAPAKRRAN